MKARAARRTPGAVEVGSGAEAAAVGQQRAEPPGQRALVLPAVIGPGQCAVHEDRGHHRPSSWPLTVTMTTG
jgi:hypothetical protein